VSQQERYRRLADGVRRIRTGAGRTLLREHTLLVAGGILAPVGLVVVIIGWYGAAHSPYQFQQIPYLISGGLLGLGLVFVGSFLYFAHWLTELIKEQRQHTAALVEALARLEASARVQSNGAPRNGSGNGNGHGASDSPGVGDAATAGEIRPRVPLVATKRGTMVHRADCVVVAGKLDLRSVGTEETLVACKLCEPYAVTT
jgi:hypothetical protein